MASTVSPGPASRRCAAVSRCQVTPLRDVHSTACGLPLASLEPAARKPCAVLVTTHTESPGSCGLIPFVEARVQDVPSGLVQTARGPTATQPPGPPASSVAACPRAAWPPPGAWTGARRQLAPPLTETKNCWRTSPPLVCEPIVTMVWHEATTRLTVWNTPRSCWPG